MNQAAKRLAHIADHILAPMSAPSSSRAAKVAVLGASGGIGQPLSMLLKTSPRVGELSLYDVANTPGVAADLGHINTGSSIKGYVGPDQLPEALQGCDLVVIPAGIPRKPGMTRDDLFNINASIVAGLCQAVATHCPQAWVAIISNPVNSTVPIAAEVMKRAGAYDPKKLFGVTTLDVVRAEKFISEINKVDPKDVSVPVIGGHAGITIVPLLSQSQPPLKLSEDELAKLTSRIQNAGTEVVEAKQGAGSATLSMAYAAARFADACLRAQAGEDVVEYAFVQSSVLPNVPFLASKLRLGSQGTVQELGLGPLSSAEQRNIDAMTPELLGSIKKGIEFVEKQGVEAANK
ncbi:malate dehydrogenase [Dunaliella salina]|uniref:Malate dehydrogenase n=1 Tax=Dunaliella salina TaxID=3046 RepID=A0ABQ7GLT8_DUNSA|nr:malate dehydrogenase [Dunaliella salina]|eukprot:KAF5835579.1 malate dehydrogenase [Dunaliella salina]